MKSFVKRFAVTVLLIFLCVNIFSCTSKSPFDLYDGEFLERRLALPYNIEAVLSQNGEKFDVVIESTSNIGTDGRIQNGEFKIRFTSGDVTEGLTVEFFDNGVFLFFDDLRFKTNSEIFTNLEALKAAFEILGAPYIEKYVTDAAPVEGADILEIGVKSAGGDIKAYVSGLDGKIIRLSETLNGTDIVLDIKKFENNIDIGRQREEQGEVFDVVDDYINM